MMDYDTIAAVATPPGSGGIGIVRLSGTRAHEILRSVFHPAGHSELKADRRMIFGRVLDEGEVLDECLAVLMASPASYTGEDVAELQLHGGSWHVNRVLELCLRKGARLAEPGEFTKRAFLNGRMDLSQAEAVMAVIHAEGEQAHRAAINQMEGGTADFVREAADELYRLQASIAACVDYPEEISDDEAIADLLPGIENLAERLENACDAYGARLLSDGLTVTLYGHPNVGKSSILNALLGEERAIVTEIPGTTRDTVSGDFFLNGVKIHLTDTAGLRETEDRVEKIGVERSRQAMRNADVPVLVLDGHAGLTMEDKALLEELPPEGLILLNKSDLEQTVSLSEKKVVLSCSALQPETLKPFLEILKEKTRVSERMTLSQPRHLDAVRRTIGHLRDAMNTLKKMTPDLAATDLEAAQAALGEITGDQIGEKLLDTVFSRFCVGK